MAASKMESILPGDVSAVKLLILSDGRKGHVNQSIAFAKYIDLPYEVVNVRFKNRFFKVISYLFDKVGIFTDKLFDADIENKDYDVVVGAGSSTYYAVKVLSKKMHAKSVVMMLPKGYTLHYDYIFAQVHDNPPKLSNLIEIPVNFAYVEAKDVYKPKCEDAIGIVIGGDNNIFKMTVERLQEQLDFIVNYYKGYEIAVTTSPRTSKEVELLVESYGFDYEVIYSKNPVNPIPDFVNKCKTIVVTADSTSMISEAVSFGNCNVVILPLKSERENKFTKFTNMLAKEGYLHIFDGTIVNKNRKIDFKKFLQDLKGIF